MEILHPPIVAIVGRTNVGKSTLFNRLVEEQKSLVSDIPGTTRDRYEADCIWRGRVIRLVDTGGLDVNRSDEIEANIEEQARLAITEADLVVFVVDLQAGMQTDDLTLARLLMKTKKPVLLIGNKGDNNTLRNRVLEKEWQTFPLGAPMAISAGRGVGAGDLLDEVFTALEKAGVPPTDIRELTATSVAVVGRPNVGKSTLLNSLIGSHRFIASSREHTTREPNDTLITVEGKDYRLIDTAGVRKMAKVRGGDKLEKSGVDRTLRAVKRADVVLFVLDISKKIHAQDKWLAGELAEAGASAVIVANKWDLIPTKETNTINEYEEYIRALLPSLSYAPILFTSAESGKRVKTLYPIIDRLFQSRFTQLDKKECRKFVSQAIVRHKPSRGKGVAHPRIVFFEQTKVNPPTFQLGIRQQRRDALADSYLRFLENRLREQYDFEGTPIRIAVKARKKSHTT